MKDALNKSLFKAEYAQKTTFFKFNKDLIENSNRKKNTLKQWKQTLRKLEESKLQTKTEIDFDTIHMDFYNSFIKFLTKEGYTKNTIGGFVNKVDDQLALKMLGQFLDTIKKQDINFQYLWVAERQTKNIIFENNGKCPR